MGGGASVAGGAEPLVDFSSIVGVAEADQALVERLGSRYGLDPSLRFESLEVMLDATEPEAVSAMTSINDHVTVVEACAPRGIHVLMEKPMAFTKAGAARLNELAAERRSRGILPIVAQSWPCWE